MKNSSILFIFIYFLISITLSLPAFCNSDKSSTTPNHSDLQLDSPDDIKSNQNEHPLGYRSFPIFGSRIAVWFVGQLHLMFAAFILGVPIFAVIVEYIGICTKKQRYDRMAKEFIKLTMAAFSTTAILGALLIFIFVGFYPKFFNYFTTIFHHTLWIYALLFFGETFMLYLYRYSWDRLKDRKIRHLAYGILLNCFGITIMVLANSWVSFMISPAGIDDNGNLTSLLDAVTNFTWMPLNIHRFIANICFGGAVVAAFAGFKYLTAKNAAEKAYYDWEGYIGNFIAISSFIVLPFAGYLLTKEIYAYNQQLGISLMGGFLSWLWIIQAILIGVLFLGANYYLWVGMERIPGAERYKGYTKYLVVILALCFMVWATPHTIIATFAETIKMGGTHHPIIGFLGVMSAKNTAVNLMILATYVSFLLYRRSNKISNVGWAQIGAIVQIIILSISCITVIFYGVYGYFVEAIVRVGFSVYQVSAVIASIISISIIDIFMFRKSKIVGQIRWGEIPERSQYALLMIAVTFIWLMGLMGFARSAMRQHWHVYGVLKDTSLEAYTPALGYAANVVSVITIVFIGLLLFIFWLGSLGETSKDQKGFELIGDCGKEIGCCTLLQTTQKQTAFGNLMPAKEQSIRIDIPLNQEEGQILSGQIKNKKVAFITLIKGFCFSLALIGVFTLYSNSIPQLTTKVPEEIIISKDDLTVEEIVKMGETIFTAKGNCYVCHKDANGRGPNLKNIGALAGNRKPDMKPRDYLMESLVYPELYIVDGYSPIMPAANKSPISLNKAELLAVVAYLQSLGGIVSVTPNEVKTAIDTMSISEELKKATPSTTFFITGDANAGKTVFFDKGCNVCHMVEGDEEKTSPNLFTIGARADVEYIKESILFPDAKIIEGYKFKMPKDYIDKLSVREFNDLVAYLVSLKG